MREKFLTELGSVASIAFCIVLILFLYLGGWERLSAQVFVMLIATTVIGLGIKFFYRKKRPDFDPRQKWSSSWLIRKIIEIDEQSFPSLHAARSAGLLVLLGYYMQSLELKLFLGLLALIVSSSRVWLKRHDIQDVSAGFILGLAVGLGVLFWL